MFNDGIGVVVFLTILAIATGGGAHGGEHEQVTAGGVAWLFGKEVIGGVALGFLFGIGGYYLLEIIDNDHTELEVLTTLALVLVGSQIAAHLHISGPLAMVVMGLIIGRGNSHDSEEEGIAGEYVLKFWDLIDEAMNAILFILIGLEMLIIPFNVDFMIAGLAGIFIVLTARFLGVGIPIFIMGFFRNFEKGTVSILTWGGLRGGISVALALSLPDSLGSSKELIVTVTYSVVVFSILVQGLSIGKMVKKLTSA